MQSPIAQLGPLTDLLPDIGIPGPGDLLESIVNWILEQLGFSRGNSLGTAMEVLDDSRGPNIFTEWYASAFGNSLGLALHFALLVVAVSMFVVLFKRNGWHQLGSNFLNVVVLVWWGEIFFFILNLCFMFSDGLTSIMKLFATIPKGNDADWMDSLTELPAVADLFSNLGLGVIGSLIGWLLSIEVFIVATGMYVVGIMSIFAFPLRNSGVWGERFARWTTNSFFTILLTKPFMMFWLAFGSALIRLGASVPGMNAQIGLSLFFTLMAVLTPILLLVISNKVYAKVQGHIKAEVKGQVKSEDKSNKLLAAAAVGYHLRSVDLEDHTGHVNVARRDKGVFHRVVESELIRSASKTHPVGATAAAYHKHRTKNDNGKPDH